MNTFNFYHYKTLSAFQTDLSSGTFTENDLAFIKESKLLYTHGLYYDCTGLDELQIKDLELINVIDEVLSLTVDKMVKASGLNADLSYSSNNEIIASAKSIAEALELLANFLSTGGIPDAPSDGVTYGRKDGSWVKANYGTPDEVLNIDEFLSLIGSETHIEVPTPEGVFEKVENACNKGICYLDMGRVATGLVIPMVMAKTEVKNEQVGYAIIASYEVYYNESYSIKMKILAQVEKDKSTVTMSQLVIPKIGTIAVLEDLTLLAYMDGYSKPSSYSAISSSDNINKAIGKLESGLSNKLSDAPSDGRKYARMNGEWVMVEDNLAIIEIDQTISDPATMIGGNVNGFVIQWIRKNSHRVLAKKTGDGTVTYIELDDNNSNKYFDGSAAATDGTEGDVFVKLPTFYYKGTEGDNVKLYFSLSKIDDSYVEWDTNTLIGAYEAYNDNDKLYSKSGVESSGNISQANFKSYAAARGSGYQLVDWQMHCVLGCLFYAMYGNTNSQAICGSGTDSSTKTCGETNSLGMNDTKAETNGNTMSINFWGLENWWGNKYEWIEGIESTAENTVQILSPDPSSGRSFTWYRTSVYGKHYRFGKYLDLSSDITGGGSDSVYYCDYNYGPASSGRVVRRSSNNTYTNGGVSFAGADGYPSSTYSAIFGSRLAFRGICTKAESVEAFKSLPVL